MAAFLELQLLRDSPCGIKARRLLLLALVGHTTQFLIFHGLIRVVDRVSRLPRGGVQPEVSRLLRENIALKAQVRALTDELKKDRDKSPTVSMSTRASQVFAFLLTRGQPRIQDRQHR